VRHFCWGYPSQGGGDQYQHLEKTESVIIADALKNALKADSIGIFRMLRTEK
jgi:hypothetical protein